MVKCQFFQVCAWFFLPAFWMIVMMVIRICFLIPMFAINRRVINCLLFIGVINKIFPYKRYLIIFSLIIFPINIYFKCTFSFILLLPVISWLCDVFRFYFFVTVPEKQVNCVKNVQYTAIRFESLFFSMCSSFCTVSSTGWYIVFFFGLSKL